MSPVEPAGVDAEQPFHARDEIRLGRLDDEVKVIGHEDVGVDLPNGPAEDSGQGFDECPAVAIILEDGFTAIAAVEHVIERAGVFDSDCGPGGRA